MSSDRTPEEADPTRAAAFDDMHEPAERDGVASLRDVEAEQGDEAGLDHTLDIDEREAQELGVALDPVPPDEPSLD
jgi:hypothetical protein